MQDVSASLPVGTLIRERYLIKRVLEQDRAGVVYLVEDTRAGAPAQSVFALKEIICLSQQERYQLTMDILARRRDPAQDIVRIHHVFNDDARNRVYVLTDYVEELYPDNLSEQPSMQQLDGGEEKRVGRKTPFFFRKRWTIFLFLILFLLISGGTGMWMLAYSHSIRPVVVRRVGLPSPTSRVVSTPAPLVTPTSSPGNYPDVVGSYVGTLVDIPSKASPTMLLQGIHQIGERIDGYLTIGMPLNINGNVSGTIDTAKHFQFTLYNAGGNAVMFLEGNIQSSTSLSGAFYQCAASPLQTHACVRSTSSYGIWNVLLVSGNATV